MGSSKRQRKLQAVEGRVGPTGQDEAEVARQRQRLIDAANRANDAGAGSEFGCSPLFRVDQGRVFSLVDGKELTDSIQVIPEQFFWDEVKLWGIGPAHVYDEEHQEIRSTCGRLILSRERYNLELLTGVLCQCLDCKHARETWTRGEGEAS